MVISGKAPYAAAQGFLQGWIAPSGAVLRHEHVEILIPHTNCRFSGFSIESQVWEWIFLISVFLASVGG